jgi:hypothetical protein
VKRLFSAYVIVDWSAASKPTTGADSIWIGVVKRDVRFRLAFEAFNLATRAEAEKKLNTLLDDFKKRSERVFVGFAFPLGFPRGFAEALKLPGEAPWLAVWNQIDKMVKDKADNTNNRFGVASEVNRRMTGGPFPFWGCPPRDTLTTLQPKRTRDHGPDDLPEMRHTDVAAKTASIWKLYYAGSIGGQAILGIPVAKRLKAAREGVKVWPFETGWKALDRADVEDAQVLIAEVSPALFPAQPQPGEPKDQAQVRVAAEHFARLDEAGKLGDLFAAPKGASEQLVADVERQEGWILGA